MLRRLLPSVLLCVLVLGSSAGPLLAGDSLYGKVTAVEAANVVTLDYGAGQYQLRLVGIDLPATAPLAAQARQLVASLVLGKNARMRFENLSPEGEMLVRLFTDDPTFGIRDVAVELVGAGLAQRQEGFDYPYGELAAAEAEARAAQRGLWARDNVK